MLLKEQSAAFFCFTVSRFSHVCSITLARIGMAIIPAAIRSAVLCCRETLKSYSASPNARAIVSTHQEARGLLPDDMMKVKEGK